jgi:hypothetical protein
MCQTLKRPKFGNKLPGVGAGAVPTPKNLINVIKLTIELICTLCTLSALNCTKYK